MDAGFRRRTRDLTADSGEIMTRALLPAAVLLVCGAASAAAFPGGINLSWTDCGAAGVANRTFACNTNSGTNVMVGSFVCPSGVDSLTGMEVVVDVQVQTATLPDWWHIETGGCRGTSLSSNVNFVTNTNCFDYWQGSGVSGHIYQPGTTTPNAARIRLVAAIPVSQGPIAAGTEVYGFKLQMSNARTVGSGACPGCPTAACIVLNSIKLVQGPGTAGDKFMANPALRNWVTWQADVPGCGAAITPARDRTWGAIKSLYRP